MDGVEYANLDDENLGKLAEELLEVHEEEEFYSRRVWFKESSRDAREQVTQAILDEMSDVQQTGVLESLRNYMDLISRPEAYTTEIIVDGNHSQDYSIVSDIMQNVQIETDGGFYRIEYEPSF